MAEDLLSESGIQRLTKDLTSDAASDVNLSNEQATVGSNWKTGDSGTKGHESVRSDCVSNTSNSSNPYGQPLLGDIRTNMMNEAEQRSDVSWEFNLPKTKSYNYDPLLQQDQIYRSSGKRKLDNEEKAGIQKDLETHDEIIKTEEQNDGICFPSDSNCLTSNFSPPPLDFDFGEDLFVRGVAMHPIVGSPHPNLASCALLSLNDGLADDMDDGMEQYNWISSYDTNLDELDSLHPCYPRLG